tara:strand:+ start:1366 stop:1557 length:192 start_codon:yes stop_codon:yes gene_type:complete
MKYKGIKKILREQIERKMNALWTWDKKDKNFTWIYKNYNDDLPIYTAGQLLEEIDKEIKQQAS